MNELGDVLDEDMDFDDISQSDKGFGLRLDQLQSINSVTDPATWSVRPNLNLNVTLDGARSTAWKNAKLEILFVREKVRKLVGQEKVAIDLLLDLIFGKESEIWLAFSKHIGMSHENFLRFLGVFLLGASHNKSSTQMYGKHSFIRSHAEGLMSYKSYVETWDGISRACLPVVMGQTPFWLSIQSAFNETVKKIFIVGINEQEIRLLIILDDDKVHYETRKIDSDGLKVIRHVNDNRTGHVLHTAVLSHDYWG